jgi:hypothetical protein
MPEYVRDSGDATVIAEGDGLTTRPHGGRHVGQRVILTVNSNFEASSRYARSVFLNALPTHHAAAVTGELATTPGSPDTGEIFSGG